MVIFSTTKYCCYFLFVSVFRVFGFGFCVAIGIRVGVGGGGASRTVRIVVHDSRVGILV